MTKYVIYYSGRYGGYEKHHLMGLTCENEFHRELRRIHNNGNLNNLIAGFSKDILCNQNNKLISKVFGCVKPGIIHICTRNEDNFYYSVTKDYFTGKVELVRES